MDIFTKALQVIIDVEENGPTSAETALDVLIDRLNKLRPKPSVQEVLPADGLQKTEDNATKPPNPLTHTVPWFVPPDTVDKTDCPHIVDATTNSGAPPPLVKTEAAEPTPDMLRLQAAVSQRVRDIPDDVLADDV